jgi:hypothetical protein
MKTLFLILLLPLAITAQSKPCLVKEPPPIRGLSLGIPGRELKVATHLILNDVSKVPGFEGIQRLYIDLHNDGRISELRFDYSLETEWKDLADFAKSISTTLKLPFAAWKLEAVAATMNCKGFTVTANSLNRQLKLTANTPRGSL